MMREGPQLSERTRRAVQDYTAFNTITTAQERLVAGTFGAFEVELLVAVVDCGDRYRMKTNCPLARRMLAVGLLHRVGSRAVVRRKARR